MTRQQELIKAWGHCNEDEFVALDFAMRWADSHLSEATIKKVIDLYKQWYSQQLDGSVESYIANKLTNKNYEGEDKETL